MLFRSSHQHIASSFKLDLERERRLLGIKASKSDGSSPEEEQFQSRNTSTPNNVEEIIATSRLGNASTLTSLERTELSRKLLASTTSRTVAIETLLTDEQRNDTRNLEDNDKLEELVDTALEDADNVDLLLKGLRSEKEVLTDVTKLLEKSYDIEKGVLTLERIKSLDGKIQAESATKNLPYHDFRSWLASGEATEDQILQALGTTKEQLSASSDGFSAVRWVRGLFKKDQKRAFISARQTDSEEYATDVLRAIEQSINDVHTYLYQVVQEKMVSVRQGFEKRMNVYREKYGTNIQEAASAIGVSRKALTDTIAQNTELLHTEIPNDSTQDDLMVAYNKLERLEREIILDGEHPDKGIFGYERQAHINTVAWAKNTAAQLQQLLARPDIDDKVEPKQLQLLEKTRGILEPFAIQGVADAHDHDVLYLCYSNPKTQKSITVYLASLQSTELQKQVTYFALVQAEQAEPTSDLYTRIQALQEHMLPNNSLCPVLQHEVCAELGIEERLHTLFADLVDKLSPRVTDDIYNRNVREVQAQLQLLEAAMEQLTTLSRPTESANVHLVNSIDHPEIFRRVPQLAKAKGYFSHNDECIYINTDQIRNNEQLAHTHHHEFGHALIHLLSRKTGLAAHLHITPNAVLQQTGFGDNASLNFEEALFAMAPKWKIPTDIPREEQRDLLLDEMWVRYASWLHQGKPSRTGPTKQVEQQLFSLLEDTNTSSVTTERGLFNTDDVPEEDQLMEETGYTPPPPNNGSNRTEVVNLNQEIQSTKQDLVSVHNFLKSYPTIADYQLVKDWYDNFLQKLQDDIEKPFLEQRITEEQGAKKLKALKESEDFKTLKKEIEEFESEQLRVDDIPLQGRTGLAAMFNDMSFLSIMDVVKMVKDGAEDMKRAWDRNSELKRHAVGEAITSVIPDNNIWFMGIKYTGKLKHEYKRRGLASEVAEVNQWKEAFKEIDPYELQEMLGNVEDKDQLRAVIELLYEAGRLEWNDEDFWRNLMRLSGEKMPVEACKNNDLLRDRWLRRMVTVIWDDKDKYYEWRRTNDSNYDGGMGKFTEIADQLSNVSGGLSGELKRQLSMWVDAQGPPKKEVPNAVSPHMYEKVLKYSIENGKMSMEDKLFYLVQGVRHGLISIDRLRVLAGEKGGVLLQFPFLDYFYQRNNTFPEIEAIAKRIEDKDDPFAPGTNTTYWIHLDVMRDENVRMRVAKAADRVLENIDHEDIPTLIGQLDYNQINNAANVISGSRQKITREGWKNAYTGFSTKFKAFARLSQMEGGDRSLARFTKNDAKNVASAITSYIHMDNILTGHAQDKATRPSLSWSEYDQAGPSTGNKPTKAFRNTNNKFIEHLITELGTAFDWNKFEDATGVSKDLYLHRIKGIQDPHREAEQKSAKIFNATNTFNQMLSDALASDRGVEVLKRILVEHTDVVDESEQLMEEHNRDELNIDSTVKYFRKTKEAQILAA